MIRHPQLVLKAASVSLTWTPNIPPIQDLSKKMIIRNPQNEDFRVQVVLDQPNFKYTFEVSGPLRWSRRQIPEV